MEKRVQGLPRKAVQALVIAVQLLGGAMIAGAQGTTPLLTLHGVAYDSLHAAPLAGAFVTILPSRHSTTSDTQGRFTFDSMAPGHYTLLMQHDALDSVGLSGARSVVDVADGREVIRVAVPSFNTLWRAACQAPTPPADSGLLFGTLRVASATHVPRGAAVTASWVEVGFDKSSGVTQRHWRLDAVADSLGNYTLCGIPTTTEVHLTAFDSLSTRSVDLFPLDKERVARRDLLLGDAASVDMSARGAIAGRVSGSSGTPLADAIVAAKGVPEVRSGADGRFIIRSVPVGTQQIEVRAIGMAPVYRAVDVVANDTTQVDVLLGRVTLLDSVRVVARGVRQRIVEEINDRRVMGFGHFRDSTEVSRHAVMPAAFDGMASVTVKRGPGANDVKIYLPPSGTQRLKGPCLANLWIDGIQQSAMNQPDHKELGFLHTQDIAMIEVYPRMSTTPAQYIYRGSDMGQCGTVLVWTKRILP